MLQKVVIEHFRSCENVTIDHIGPSLVLVGPNGSGKTNILKAILWAARAALSDEPVVSLSDWDGSARSITLDFLGGEIAYRYFLEIPHGSGPTTDELGNLLPPITEAISVSDGAGGWDDLATRSGAEVSVTGPSVFTMAPSTPFLSFLISNLPLDHPILIHLRPLRRYLQSIRYYPLDEPAESTEKTFLSDKVYRRWLAEYRDPTKADQSAVLKLLQMHLTNQDDLAEVEDILGSLGLIDEISIKPLDIPDPLVKVGAADGAQTLYSITFHAVGAGGEGNGGPSGWFAFEALSLGTRRVIRMVVSMIFDRGSVMLIEHPEDGIHRRLTASVFGTLRSYTNPSQIIVASHSPLVFDMLDPEEVRLVTMSRGKTEVHALPSEEIDQARRYSDQVGSLSEFLEIRHDL